VRPGARNFSRACLLVLALLASGAAAAQTGQPGPPRPRDEWQELVSPEGRFSVQMIGAAKLKTQEQDTAVGRIVLNTYMAITPAGGFGVSYADFPQPAESAERVVAILNGARDQVLATDKNRKLLIEQEINVGGYAGREWLVADAANDMLFRAWTFMAGARLYQVLMLTSVRPAFAKGQPSARPEDRDAEYEAMSKKFFGSFKLLREKPAGGAGGKNV